MCFGRGFPFPLMSTPATPSDPNRPADERNLVAADGQPVALGFEERLQRFWKQYGTLILAICVLVIAVLVGRGVWEWQQDRREADIKSEYAAASTSDQLRAFAASHAGHPLAGVAHLRLADEAFTAGNFAEAITGYEKAAVILKEGPFAARAELGKAIARIGAGNAAEGETALQQIANDANQLSSVRVEAVFHLASVASEMARGEEVQKLSEQAMQIDPSSPWTQRTLMLRSALPVASAAPAAPEATEPPPIQFNPSGR